MTDERWQQLLRLIDETFADYLSGLVALRKRIVVDLKRKLSGMVLDRPDVDESLPRMRPVGSTRRRRARERRKRRS